MLLSHLALAFLVACGDDEEATPKPVECDTGSSIVDSAPCDTSTGTGSATDTDTDTDTATQTGTGTATDTQTATDTATATDTGTGVLDTAGQVDADEDGVIAAEDCDDANALVYPGNVETCDGVDEDCDGVIDNDALDARAFFVDLDHDGFGVDGTEMYACEAPLDASEQGGDCDDENWIVYPGSLVPECGDIAFLDLNCDGSVGSDDFDGDGVTACDDCNDADPGVFPGAVEICNGGADDDCNGLADDEDPALVADAATAGKNEFYADFDFDGFTPGAGPALSCEPAPGFVSSGQLYGLDRSMRDCDDANASVSPGATEVCNGEDDNCDQLVDDADANVDAGSRRFVRDADQDGYTDGTEVAACEAPTGFVVTAANGDGDCDDTSGAVHPGAAEVCNGGIDDDCSGAADDADMGVTGVPTWYADLDEDGYVGVDADQAPVSAQSCGAPVGFYAMADLQAETDAVSGMPVLVSDCSDDPELDVFAVDVNPAAAEECNGRDDNCDGLADDADASVDPAGFTPWYLDADADGYTPAATPVETCDAPAGYAYFVWNAPADPTDLTSFVADCDDAVDTTYPDAYDAFYDGVDADCDLADDYDQDGDGVDGMLADGTPGTDCNDVDANVFPGAPVDAAYDGVDQDCSNGDLVDVDGDGEPSEAAGGLDCDDNDASIKPGLVDVAYDGIDQDCSGSDLTDVDGDGVAGGPSGSDCDDTDAAVRPGANELCSTAADDDCDGVANEGSAVDATRWYVDADADHFSTGAYQVACAAPDATYAAEASLVSAELDCDDAHAAANPGVTGETCATAFDDDCDGRVNDTTSVDASVFYEDVDGDHYTTGDRVEACAAPSGYVAAGTLTSLTAADCDDSVLAGAAVNPGMDEDCDTPKDDDCDGRSNDATSVDAAVWRQDADGDGFATFGSEIACDAPAGYVAAAGVDATRADCDDARVAVNPAAQELCTTGLDDDCDGQSNEADAVDASTWFVDGDGDDYGFVSAATLPVIACDQPGGYVGNVDDCDDGDAMVSPSASELCSTGYDDDCDGLVNDATAADATTWYTDLDGDQHAAGVSEVACVDPGPAAYVAGDLVSTTDDCDDMNAQRYPGNTEVCDAADVDEDCDTLSDDADPSASIASKTNWYTDTDGDGYGSGEVTVACNDPGVAYVPSLVSSSIDCDDARSATNPGATEVCSNLYDDDCSGYDPLTGAELPAPWNAAVDTCDTFAGLTYTLNGVAPTYNVAIRGEVVGAGAGGGDRFGGQISGGGDLDGDGKDDLVVSAFQADNLPSTPTVNDVGAVYWFRGGLTAGAGTVTSTAGQVGSYRVKILGGTASEMIGYNAGNISVAIVPDLTGDGQDDLLVGSSQLSSGKTYVFSGATLAAATSGSTITVSSAAATLSLGGAAGSADGWAVAPAGDVNGDGVQDVIVGSPGNQTNVGRAGIYLGGVRSYTTTAMVPNVLLQGGAFGSFLAANQKLGAAVAGAGDIDGDGFDDVVVGMTYTTAQGTQSYPATGGHLAQGGVGIYYGSAMTGVAASPTVMPSSGAAFVQPGAMAVITGENAYDRFGVALSGMGDQDGDGYDDFIVGADLYGHSSVCTAITCEKGRVYVINGGVVDPSSTGNANRRFATGSVTAAATAADVTFDAMASADQEFLGRGVRGGDFNRDGYGDVIMGVPQGGSNGFAYLVYGPIADGAYTNLDATAHAKITATLAAGQAGNTFGSPIGFAGDVNNDGYDDALFGHMTFNGGTGATGRAYAFFGRGQ